MAITTAALFSKLASKSVTLTNNSNYHLISLLIKLFSGAFFIFIFIFGNSIVEGEGNWIPEGVNILNYKNLISSINLIPYNLLYIKTMPIVLGSSPFKLDHFMIQIKFYKFKNISSVILFKILI